MSEEIIDVKGEGAPKGGEGAAAPETVAKGEFDRVSSELEELRGEVLSPEYLEFLANKDKPKLDVKPEVKVEGDGFGGLSDLFPKELDSSRQCHRKGFSSGSWDFDWPWSLSVGLVLDEE